MSTLTSSSTLKPKSFVKWSEFQKILELSLTVDIKTSLIMKSDGSILCISGNNSNENIIGILISNIWESYEKLNNINIINNNINGSDKKGENNESENTLNLMLFENNKGKIAITKISNFLLCLCANETVDFGLLRKKVLYLNRIIIYLSQLMTLKEYLEEPLNQVYPKA